VISQRPRQGPRPSRTCARVKFIASRPRSARGDGRRPVVVGGISACGAR
jgi:hypothetical protein